LINADIADILLRQAFGAQVAGNLISCLLYSVSCLLGVDKPAGVPIVFV
jgi:hypothetical protein